MNINKFFEEKDLPFTEWEFGTSEGWHLINSDVIIDMIKSTKGLERKRICDTLFRIDFVNGDILKYLKYIAANLTHATDEYAADSRGVGI